MKVNRFKGYFTFRNAYLLILFAMLASLPLSKYVASASQILLAVLWLIEGKFREKWSFFKSRPEIWVFLLLYGVHLVGMLWTSDLSFGLHDLKIKLPLLLLPIVLGTIPPLNKNEMKVILGGFTGAVLLGTFISLSIMLGFGPSDYTSDRETSLFISHIRFALMIDLSVFILFYYLMNRSNKKFFPSSFLLLTSSLYLIIFLFLLKSLTGLVVLILGGMILSVRWAMKQKDLMVKWFVVVGVATLPVLIGFYVSDQVGRFYTQKDDLEHLDRTTALGNLYWHDLDNSMIENGWKVGLYQCEPEMREAWNKRSSMNYDGLDKKNQELKYTLIRYLTSLGLRKDAHGISLLTDEDINLIEKGFANSLYREPKRLRVRIYETIWEIDQYHKGANPSGHSLTQRLEYLKTGLAIYRDHKLFGTGTGDTKTSFERKYEELKSPLKTEWRLRAHNQFLSFLIAFGWIGFILILGAILAPPFIAKRSGNFFVLMFFIAALLSFLNEDTLETQAGVAFFAVFYSLFVFAVNRESGIVNRES
jgi:hypothetical protein